MVVPVAPPAARFLTCCPGLATVAGPDARRQWERFIEALTCAGNVRIERAELAGSADDLVLPAHAALISDGLAIISSSATPPCPDSRCLAWLRDHDFSAVSLAGAAFGGAGDALFDRRQPLLYLGIGRHTARPAAERLSEILGVRVLALELTDSRFERLDSALCPLGNGHVLVYFDAFSVSAQRALRRMIRADRVIEIPPEDASALACQAVEIGDTLVLHSASPRLRARLFDAEYRTFATELSAFSALGTGAKDLILRLDDGPAHGRTAA